MAQVQNVFFRFFLSKNSAEQNCEIGGNEDIILIQNSELRNQNTEGKKGS